MFVRQEQLAKEIGVSVSTLWRWRRDGKMPPVVTLSSRVVGWQRKDIERWLEEQKIDATCYCENSVLA
ncbi:TPA: AlpA family phage regulatory protein [Vibrio parahaemolyticus]|nr:AlpA family phage regulatory protein [Vibrio parahaemolyticus]